MEYIIIAFLVILIGFAFFIYKKLDQKQNNSDEIKSSLDLERERKKDLNEFKETILEKINTHNTSLKEEFVSIKERVSSLQKTQEQMDKIANEVIDFKNLFNNKTQRGRLGEESLEILVSDTVSKQNYKFQHTFSNGSRVDCLLTLGTSDLAIPIDSKFSWENYKIMSETKNEIQKKQAIKDFATDVTNHIKEVAKYVIAGETAPYAFMFIASRGVFDAIVNSKRDFVKTAREKGVILVSPDTLFPHLMNLKIFIQFKEYSRLAKFLQKEVGAVLEDTRRFGERFSNISKSQNKISQEFRELSISVEKIINRSEKIKNLDLGEVTKIENKK